MNWKKLFVKEEEKPQSVQKPQQAAPTVVPMYGAAPAVIHNPVNINASQDYNKLIEDALTHANKDGVDYFEFRISIKAFDGKPLPDAQKYEYAFMPMSAMKVTPMNLVSSANYYKGIIQGMKEDFDHQLDETVKQQVTNKEQEVVALQAQIKELTQKSEKLYAEAQASKIQLDAERTAFGYAHQAKMQEIEIHINNINTFLNATPQQQPQQPNE